MRRRLPAALLVVVAACIGGSDATTTSVLPPVSTTVSSTSSTDDTDEVSDLALYLATIDLGLEGTDLEGAAFEEPEPLIDTGVLFCTLLDDGLDPIDVMRGWSAALASEGGTPSEDDLMLGGVILGSAVRFICPDHLPDLDL